MKTLRLLATSLMLLVAALDQAFAASSTPTTTVYNSGILVLVFVGFCALVVVIQLIPAIMTLWGMLMGIATHKNPEEAAEARARK